MFETRPFEVSIGFTVSRSPWRITRAAPIDSRYATTALPSAAAAQGDALAANPAVSGSTYTYSLQACATANLTAGTCAATQTISVIVPGSGGTGLVCNGFPSTEEIDLDWETTRASIEIAERK